MIRSILAISINDLRHLVRSRTTFALALAFPFIFTATMGFAFGQEGERAPISVGYINRDDAPVVFNGANSTNAAHSITLLSLMQENFNYEGFEFKFDFREFEIENEVIRFIKDGDFGIGFILPANFSESLNNKTIVKIQLFQDISSPNTAIIERETVEGVIQGYCNSVMDIQGATEISRTTIQPEAGDITYVEYMVPGMISVVILWIGIQRSAVSIAREREQDTIYRLLSSPTPPAAILIGKGLAVFCSTLISVAIVIVSGIILFEVELTWRLEFLFFVGLASLTAIGLGLIISTKSKDEHAATAAVTLVALPLQFFLDAFFPIDFFPEPAPTIAHYIPLTRASVIFRDILIYNRPLGELVADAVYVGLWGIGLFMIGVLLLWRNTKEK